MSLVRFPVTPRRNRNRSDSVAVFSCFDGSGVHKHRTTCGAFLLNGYICDTFKNIYYEKDFFDSADVSHKSCGGCADAAGFYVLYHLVLGTG